MDLPRLLNWRLWSWLLLIAGAAAVFLLQPRLPIRFSDFILPTASIGLVIAGWWWTRAPEQHTTREDLLAAGVLVGVVLLMALNRFLPDTARLTPSRPPDLLALTLGLALAAAVAGSAWAILRRIGMRVPTGVFILLLIAVFAVLKTEPLTRGVATVWRSATGQDVAIASALDLNWLGFSYLAFRLLHTLMDRRSGLLPALSLREYATYALFPASLIAGPIDRADRFAEDYRTPKRWDADRWAQGGARIAMGLFKKLVIADTLALGLSLNAVNVDQALGAGALWLLLYGYAMRLYFDFSGYTDIAIGVGIWLGIRLPENFDRPYLRTTITAFWQSWHKTLSDWARFYVFSPLTRALLRRERKPSAAAIVGIGHLATMLVIGLWHGVTINFIIWGVWQAAGLYAHKRWSDATRAWYRGLNQKPRQRHLWTVFSWFITFHFIALGWVWFALPDFEQSLRALGRLFGIGW